jgi:hypothetical protein
MSKSQ